MEEMITLEEYLEKDKELKLIVIKEQNIKMDKLANNRELRKCVNSLVKKKKKQLAEEDRLEKEFQEFKKDYIVKYLNCSKEELLEIMSRLAYKNIKLSNKIDYLDNYVEELKCDLESAWNEVDSNLEAISKAEAYSDGLNYDINKYLYELENERERYSDLEDEYSDLENRYSDLEDEYSDLENRYRDLED